MKSHPYWKFAMAVGLCAARGLCTAAPAASGESLELGEIRVTEKRPLEGSADQGYRVKTIQLGPLGNSRLQDTPFTVNTVSSELIRNTQATNSTEALKYVPTVYANTGASQITPYFTLRGFSASTWSYNMALDGMRSFDVYQAMEDKARIEVLSGASSFLYGVTSPAGMINYVTKRPSAEPVRELTVGLYDRQLFSQIDLGGRLAENPDITYRLNLGYGDKGDTGIAHQSQERQVLSGAVDWKITPDTTLGLNAAHSRRSLEYAQALFMTTTSIGIPKAPDATKNWGAPYTGATDATDRIGLTLDSVLNDIFTLRASVRHSEIEREYLLNRQIWQNSSLAYKWRLDSQQNFHTQVDQYAVFLDTHLTTGFLRHKVTLGTTGDDFDSGNNGARSQTFATTYTGNLYDTARYPAYSQPVAGTSTAQRTRYSTLMLADQIALGEQWSLMLGGTQARVNDQITSTTAAGVSSIAGYDKSKTTPAASISFKPIPAVTTYVSYVEALQQGFTAASGTTNAGQIFSPYVSRQKEAGVKTTLAGLSANVAYFQINQANQYIDPATNLASQDGREIHKGWEVSVTGRASDRISLTGGFTVLDARIDKATVNIGKTPQGVPEKMARLYAEYELPEIPGLMATGGISYTGKVPWDAANTLYVNAVTLLDAGLRYQNKAYGNAMTWRLTVANLTGKDYWTTRSGILYLGAPRTLTLSASLAF